ncbi:MAG: type I-U CRISPR-associated protein Cas5/Cas6 [Gammaproteobacteria bacterium]|nr:type I-U CRISPR-associated protein Cas5/Cas6 [Gammaproteobacteria bacterium]
MDTSALLIEVNLLGQRWHGVGDWPPSPFRLFQALVAGAYGGRWVAEDSEAKDDAFRWLETLAPPTIAAPPKCELSSVTHFVPNNDLDSVGGDPRRISELRVAKSLGAVWLESNEPILYLWTFEGANVEAERIAALAERLHTLGRGLDPAFARGMTLPASEARTRLLTYTGSVAHPRMRPEGGTVRCPTPGSLASLIRRQRAVTGRFLTERSGRKAVVSFRQPPKPQFRSVAYDRPPACVLYDLKPIDGSRPFRPSALANATRIARAVREVAAHRLSTHRTAETERFVIGRGAGSADVLRRVRIVPLPTIGHRHADPSIRRVLVQIPPDCPFKVADVDWALSGSELFDPETGETWGTTLVRSGDRRMLRHFGIDEEMRENGSQRYRRWQTVTPSVLPNTRQRDGASGDMRRSSEERAAGAVVQALRHAGVSAQASNVRLQREPFHTKGLRADAFDAGRFPVSRLHHLEVRFSEPVSGPLVIGDGRWLGLGLMRPVREAPPPLHVFVAKSPTTLDEGRARDLATALRRAVMARAEAVAGARLQTRERLPTYFTGHTPDGGPARSGQHEHLFFLAADTDLDGHVDRLIVVAPELADRSLRGMRAQRDPYRVWLDDACAELRVLRSNALGVIKLARIEPDQNDPILGRSRTWISSRPYRPTQHPKRSAETSAAIEADVALECRRRKLPEPNIHVLDLARGPRNGLRARVRLRFPLAVEGPIVLGAGSHLGDGLFIHEVAPPG